MTDMNNVFASAQDFEARRLEFLKEVCAVTVLTHAHTRTRANRHTHKDKLDKHKVN